MKIQRFPGLHYFDVESDCNTNWFHPKYQIEVHKNKRMNSVGFNKLGIGSGKSSLTESTKISFNSVFLDLNVPTPAFIVLALIGRE